MRAGALDICALGAIDMPPCKQLDICPHADNRYSHVKCERKRIFYIICIVKYAGVARAIFAPLAQKSIYLLSPHPPSPRRRSPFPTKIASQSGEGWCEWEADATVNLFHKACRFATCGGRLMWVGSRRDGQPFPQSLPICEFAEKGRGVIYIMIYGIRNFQFSVFNFQLVIA